mgnify:CR=1 FL=1
MFMTFFESFSSGIGTGGLFDFDATLPFVAFQFLILMFVLNNILYNPLLKIINERNDYIVSTLTRSSELIIEADEIIKMCEEEIIEARKTSQSEISYYQKRYKEAFNSELELIQKQFDGIVEKLTLRLSNEKEIALHKLKEEIEDISTLIERKILLI